MTPGTYVSNIYGIVLAAPATINFRVTRMERAKLRIRTCLRVHTRTSKKIGTLLVSNNWAKVVTRICYIWGYRSRSN